MTAIGDIASIGDYNMALEVVRSADARMVPPYLGHQHCRCRRQIDPACRFPVTQRDAHVIVAGHRMAVADGGSGKSRHLGQIHVGTNTLLI